MKSLSFISKNGNRIIITANENELQRELDKQKRQGARNIKIIVN